ncbi:hypothetical protein L1987_31559 [Smallanthus sonchifolius]|uniref:Uncharacterized protein n=1 Tax=Smallanthus sonchifolius TaxID=185202 RepID=A0ACB9I593_9ASTR|nr:hypothetical protein L1987_31559 [Smallanthus sonchifolius]
MMLDCIENKFWTSIPVGSGTFQSLSVSNTSSYLTVIIRYSRSLTFPCSIPKFTGHTRTQLHSQFHIVSAESSV